MTRTSPPPHDTRIASLEPDLAQVTRRFRYRFWPKLIFAYLPLFCTILTGLILVMFLLMRIANGTILDDLEGIFVLVSIPFFVVLLAELSAQLTCFGDIVYTAAGLRIRVFGGWWYWEFIPWETMLWIKHYPGSRSYSNFTDQWVIGLRRRYFWLQLVGFHMRLGFFPVIAISAQMHDYEDLVALIQQHGVGEI